MADWDPYNFSDAGDESDSDGAGGLVVAEAGSDGGADAGVQLLTRLADTASSGAMFERKSTARGLLEAFRQIYYSEQDVGGVIAVIEKLVDDVEHSVRTEVMDQMPQIALFCHEESPRLDFVVPQHILPYTVRALTDHFTQVRQASQSGLLILLERGIIASSQITDCVLPIIVDYTQQFAPEELRAEMTAFMIKLAPLAGKEITVNSYLDLFCRLCDDTVVQVRKVCATGMGDLANVVGTRLTEIVLLPRFLALCKDTMWSVRKNCADVFTVVSTVCQLVTRKKILAPAFVALLQDSSKWVRVAAYQTLGPFITTFAADDSTTCTQESSEIEQAFLERFIPQQQEQHHQQQHQGKEASGVQPGSGCSVETTAAGKEGERNLGICRSGTSESTVVVTNENRQEENAEKLPVEEGMTGCSNAATSGAEGDDEAIATSDLSPLKNSGEADSSHGACEISGIEMERKSETTISNDNSSETGSLPESSTSATLPGDANDKTNEECCKQSEPDDELGLSQESSRPSLSDAKKVVVEGGGSGIGEEEEEEEVKEFDLERLDISKESEEAKSHTAVRDEGNGSQNATAATGRRHEGDAGEVVLIEKEEKECAPAPVVVRTNDTQGEEGAGGDGGNMGKGEEQVCMSAAADDDHAMMEDQIAVVGAAAAAAAAEGDKEDGGSKEQVSSEENIEVIQEAIEMSFDEEVEEEEESHTEPPVTDENVNNSEEPMETDELFDGVDDDKQEEQSNENGDFPGASPFPPSAEGAPGSCSIQPNSSSSPSRSITDVHRSYMNLYNASRGHAMGEDSGRMPTVRLTDPYDDDDWDPDNTFPYGDDLASVCGGKACRPRLLEELPKSLTVSQQDVVPVDLLEHYTSMCEPMKNQAIDNALSGFCAYNLPAVVLTLGPQNWSILRECYESLACSMQWKIRYTLASSLHEIARVIGPELAERDLVPFFNALVKDVDEVRVGILKNLASFIKILGTVERRKCLESLRSFLDTDNERNWRFRLEILYQLEQLTELYEADEIYKYLRPVALDLVKDGVAEVRKTALSVITNLILRVRSSSSTVGCEERNLVHDFLLELVESLCQSDKWVRRQSFAALSGQLIGMGALQPVQFAEDVLPHLANLSCDPVPNVRLIVAQTMVCCVRKLEEFDEQSSQLVSKIVETLQYDKDRDVRYFSSFDRDKEEEDEEEEGVEEAVERMQEVCSNSEM